MKLSLDGYTQITKGKIKSGDLVESKLNSLQKAHGLIGCDINDCSDWKCYRKMPKPKLKTSPNLPNGLPTPPKDYVFLGRVKDITTPGSWGSLAYIRCRELLDLALICTGEKSWFQDPNGWMPSNAENYIAAKVGSPLYNMQNFTTTKNPDLAFEIVQLKAKLQSAEETLNVRTAELNSAKNELLEAKRQLGNVEKARDTYYNMYHAATSERIKVKAELTEIKETAKKLNSLVNS